MRLWEEAASSFQLALQGFGKDPVSAYYIEKCRGHREHPPDESWDGTIEMETK
jgi:hypothetical protein